MGYGIKLKIWGNWACFTRPEMKVERVSYDVITPSAARGILEAIYWKPSIRWVVDKIHVMKPIQFENIRRNELASKLSDRSISKAMKNGDSRVAVFIEEDRQQRAAMVLRDVEYVIEAHFIGLDEDGKNEGKHLDIFNRRARSGKCFNQPYMGCREFSASFELLDGDVPISGISGTRDLGWMLYDMYFGEKNRKGKQMIEPMFFHSKLVDGVIAVPPPDSEEVKR